MPGWTPSTITHGPGASTTALLLAGWLAAQLQWTFVRAEGAAIHFRSSDGIGVCVILREEPGRALAGVRMSSPQASFEVARRSDSAFLHTDIRLPDRDAHYLVPGGKDDLVSLLDDDLMSGGKHRVYLKAAAAILAVL